MALPPIEPSLLPLLDPQYVAFYNNHIINTPPASRASGTLIQGSSSPSPVGKIQDFSIERTNSTGPSIAVRTFTPSNPPPENGYPVLLYFHGGGWVLGNLDTENSAMTHICSRASAVVISVDYRLAPESPYPSAAQDALESFLWLLLPSTISSLSIDTSKIAVGGSSAGANLAADLVHQLVEEKRETNIAFMLLIVPVVDFTASPSTHPSQALYSLSPDLSAQKLNFCKSLYAPLQETWTKPSISPTFYSDENFGKLPKTFIGLAEVDILRSEGEIYAEKLRKAGGEVGVKIYKGMPHAFGAMDGVLDGGRQLIEDVCAAMKVL